MEQTVFIIDDDDTVRDATNLLVKSMGFSTMTFESAVAFLERYDPRLQGCLILDVRMPTMSGLDLQKKLLERHSKLPIIFITGHGDVPLAVQAMRLGAIDFLEKPYNDQQLLDNINRALELNRSQNATAVELEEARRKLQKLTPRELEVMDRVVNGAANKVIAAELGLSERTIEIHRSRVMSKMECKSVAALVTVINLLKTDS